MFELVEYTGEGYGLDIQSAIGSISNETISNGFKNHVNNYYIPSIEI